MSDDETTNTVTERGTGAVRPSRRPAIPNRHIELRTTDAQRGGHGELAVHGDVLAGGVPDLNRTVIAIERVGVSGPHAGRTLFSDRTEDGGIRNAPSAHAVAVEKRHTIRGAYERGSREHLEAIRQREAETDSERARRIAAAIAVNRPESIVAPGTEGMTTPGMQSRKRE
jgi:hypothetical protein